MSAPPPADIDCSNKAHAGKQRSAYESTGRTKLPPHEDLHRHPRATPAHALRRRAALWRAGARRPGAEELRAELQHDLALPEDHHRDALVTETRRRPRPL